MNKIQKISTYMSYIFNIMLVSIPILNVICWTFMGTEVMNFLNSSGFFLSDNSMSRTQALSTVHWLPSLKMVGFSADLLSSLPTILSLFALKIIFRNYQKGEIFSTNNALSYKKIAWIFFLNALIIKPLSKMLMTFAVSFNNPHGQRFLSLEFGTPNLEDLFIGIILIVVSWVMLEASKLHDEQKLTV